MTTFKTRQRFREHGQVIRTRGRWAWVGRVLWPVGAFAFLFGVLAMGTHWDEQAEQRQLQAELAERQAHEAVFQAGLNVGHADMVASLRAAYQHGLNEGAARCSRGGQ